MAYVQRDELGLVQPHLFLDLILSPEAKQSHGLNVWKVMKSSDEALTTPIDPLQCNRARPRSELFAC